MPVKEEYEQMAKGALQDSEDDTTRAHTPCSKPKNMLLMFFLRRLKNMLMDDSAKEKRRWGSSVADLMRSVAQCTCVITRVGVLTKLTGCGDKTAAVVQEHLWRLYPPEEPTEEEQQEEARFLQHLRDVARAKSARASKAASSAVPSAPAGTAVAPAAASAAARAGAAGHPPGLHSATGPPVQPAATGPNLAGSVYPQYSTLGLLDSLLRPGSAALPNRPVQPPSSVGGVGLPSSQPGSTPPEPAPAKRKRKKKADAAAVELGGAADGDDAAGAAAPKKRRVAAPKAYKPGVGTANYAFMIVLYKELKSGVAHMSKEDLMKLAEQSGLAKHNVFNNGQTGAPAPPNAHWAGAGGPNPQTYYNGWSSVKRLENNDPPLVQRWSNPIKVRLTPEGVALAAELYKHAVAVGTLQQDPAIQPDADIVAASGGTAVRDAGTGTSAAVPAVVVPHPTIPSGSSAAAAARSSVPTAPAVATVARRSQPPPTSAAVKDAPIAIDLVDDSSSEPEEDVLAAPRASLPAHAQPRGVSDAVASRRTSGRLLQPLSSTRADACLIDDVMAEDDVYIDDVIVLEPNVWSQLKKQLLQAGLQSASAAAAAAAAATADGGSSRLPVRQPTQGATAALPRRPLMSDPFADQDVQAASLSASQSQRNGPPADTLQQHHPSTSRQNAAAQRPPHPPSRHVSQPDTNNQRPSGMAHGGAAPLRAAHSAPQPGTSSSNSQASGTSRSQSGREETAVWRLPRLGSSGLFQDCSVRLPPLPPGAKFSDVYKVVLLIDNRERMNQRGINGTTMHQTESRQMHTGSIRQQGVEVDDSEALPAGDALWVAQSLSQPGERYVLDFVVERKAIGDLVQSIKDKRYEAQKYWMRRCGLAHPMYLLEGNPDTLVMEAERKAVKTAMFSTSVLDGFTVLETRDSRQTMTLYADMSKAIVEVYKDRRAGPVGTAAAGATGGNAVSSALSTLDDFKRRVKLLHTSLTVRDLWGLMLTSLPGVGSEKAEAVLQAHPTPHSLWSAYRATMQAARRNGQDAVGAARQMLERLSMPNSTRLTLGKKASDSIYCCLFQNGWQPAS